MSRNGWLFNAAFGGCLAAFLLVSPALGQGEEQKAAEKPQGQSADLPAVKLQPATAPVAPTEPVSGGHDNERQTEKVEKPQNAVGHFWAVFAGWIGNNVGGKDGWAQWIMALLGGVATVISIWAVVLLKQTLRATREAVEEGRKGTAAAKDAAIAAQEQVNIARESQAATERAFIGYATLKHQDIEGGRLYSVVVKNSGNSRARKAINSLSHCTSIGSLPDDFEFPTVYTTTSEVIPIYIEPSGTFALGRVLVTPNLAPDITTDRRLNMWGFIEYNDIIPGTPRRRTEIGIELRAITASGQPRTTENFYVADGRLNKYNGADEDCLHAILEYEERVAETMDARETARQTGKEVLIKPKPYQPKHG